MSHSEDFDLTKEEADRLKTALKDEKFRKLLSEYVEEISDPENRRQYEQEITQLESERGVNVTFVNPTPGFVLKSVQLPDKKKAFVNICQSAAVAKASGKPAQGRAHGEDWSIPFSLSPGREDLDKSGQRCMVYDVVYHPETFEKSTKNSRFEDILVETALDGIERELKVTIDRNAVKKLKMKYKGMPHSTVIRKKTKDSETVPDAPPLPWLPLPNETKKTKEHQRPLNEPKYTVTHVDDFSMLDYTNTPESTRIRRPKELLVSVELPGVMSADSIQLDVFEKQILLDCSDPAYHLELSLPYQVNEEKCAARLDKATSCLTLTLPVLAPKMPPLNESCSVDAEGISEETRANSQPGSHEPPSRSAEPGSHEVPSSGAQPGSHEVPSSGAQPGSHEVPSSGAQSGSHEVPSSGAQPGSHEVPSSGAQPGSHEVPSSGAEPGSHEVPSSGALPGSHEVPSSGAEPGSHEVPSSGAQPGSHECKSALLDATSRTWSWSCPPYNYHQNEMCVSFVLHVTGVKEGSVVTHFEDHMIHITFSSANHSQGFSFFAAFCANCKIEPSSCKVDISPDNVVVILKKAQECKGVWDKMQIGSDSVHNTDKLFITSSNLLHVLSAPDSWASSSKSSTISCEVASVNEEALRLEVKTVSSQEQAKSESQIRVDAKTREQEVEQKEIESQSQEPIKITKVHQTDQTVHGPRELFCQEQLKMSQIEANPQGQIKAVQSDLQQQTLEPMKIKAQEQPYTELREEECRDELSINTASKGVVQTTESTVGKTSFKEPTTKNQSAVSFTLNFTNHLLFELD